MLEQNKFVNKLYFIDFIYQRCAHFKGNKYHQWTHERDSNNLLPLAHLGVMISVFASLIGHATCTRTRSGTWSSNVRPRWPVSLSQIARPIHRSWCWETICKRTSFTAASGRNMRRALAETRLAATSGWDLKRCTNSLRSEAGNWRLLKIICDVFFNVFLWT